jgi:hypothetical protein
MDLITKEHIIKPVINMNEWSLVLLGNTGIQWPTYTSDLSRSQCKEAAVSTHQLPTVTG